MKQPTKGEQIASDHMTIYPPDERIHQLRTAPIYARQRARAAAIDAAIAEAVKAEREAIAVLCETHRAVTVLKPNKGEPRRRLDPFFADGSEHAGQVYAAAIRARGNL